MMDKDVLDRAITTEVMELQTRDGARGWFDLVLVAELWKRVAKTGPSN